MAAQKTETTTLSIEVRGAEHSRAVRRLRRSGRIPGILYGLGTEPTAFSADARELRHALHGSGAVIELHDGTNKTAAVLKAAQRHPVRGDVMHVDLLRVDLNKPIQAPVPLHLVGSEDAPGIREGGILDHSHREVTVEALPNDIPETIEFDVSGMAIHDVATIADLTPIPGVTFVDEPEVMIATISAPRLETDVDELETETVVVGESDASEDGGEDAAEASDGDDAASDE